MPNKLRTFAILRGDPAWGDWVRRVAERSGLSILDTIDQGLRRQAEAVGVPPPVVSRVPPRKSKKSPEGD